mmetsp:Transcript_55188/g.107959  ORF Transcript_55188/g.107959 Transcript_55188/m.107959 type:complete len:143 (+) Transcript_55188:502-930(+)
MKKNYESFFPNADIRTFMQWDEAFPRRAGGLNAGFNLAGAARTSGQSAPPPREEKAVIGEHINLRVWLPDSENMGAEGLVFRMRRTTRFEKLMNSLAQRVGVSIDHYRFMHNLNAIGREQTPNEIGAKDGDDIHAYLPQTGC